MIVDEIDAFPYHADQMLQYAVRQAMKEKAARIYLTATPDEKWKRNFRRGKQKVSLFREDTIVTRYQFLYLVGAEIGRKASIIKNSSCVTTMVKMNLNKSILFFICSSCAIYRRNKSVVERVG